MDFFPNQCYHKDKGNRQAGVVATSFPYGRGWCCDYIRCVQDRVYVMFLGKIMESGKTKEIYGNPLHPYTRFLMSAVPEANPRMRNRERTILEGDVPSPVNPPSGCRFHTRCPMAKAICGQQEPPLVNMDGHYVACHMI